MSQIHLLSAADQVAAHLRSEIHSGIRTGILPGIKKLATEIGINHKTVASALALLENEGLLLNQGTSCGRLINPKKADGSSPGLRFAILPMDNLERGIGFHIKLRHLLEEAGHLVSYTDHSLIDLKMDVQRIAALVKKTKADAWIISAGSREILEWFMQQPFPSFSMFGRRDGLAIAGVGPDKSLPMAAATKHLIELGHRRISFVIRRQHRLPTPTPSVHAYLQELENHGIQVGNFNLPDWEETKEGFQALLQSLFQLTPPTAIITDEAFLYIATHQFITAQGMHVPQDVSLISTDHDKTFTWCAPSIAHISWAHDPVVRRIIQWTDNIRHGRKDLRQTLTKAHYIHGGTVGPISSA